MGEPNTNGSAMVHVGGEIVDGNGMIHDDDLVHGGEMIHANEVGHDEMIHGNRMIQSNENVQGNVLVAAEAFMHGNELVHVEGMVNGDEIHGNELISAEMTPQTSSRRPRKKSQVWEHFTIEVMPGGSSRAYCNLCKQTFAYSSGTKIAGTSHLKWHITLRACAAMKNDDTKKALVSAGDDGDGTFRAVSFTSFSMGEQNSNESAMVHVGGEIVDGNGVIHDDDLVHGGEMIHANEVGHDEMIHGNGMIQSNENVQGHELVSVAAEAFMHGNELVHVEGVVNGDEIHGNELISAEMTPQTSSRRRRKKSLVWEHFTVEVMPGGSSRACCNLCKQSFAYSSGTKIAGTSHLKRHITLRGCVAYKKR